MAYDESLAQILRDDLTDQTGITERAMFGGVAFLLYGNMVCGVHTKGAMFRVGKSREAEARAIDGAGHVPFTGRPKGAMVDVTDDALQDDENRASWLRLSFQNANSLPAR